MIFEQIPSWKPPFSNGVLTHHPSVLASISNVSLIRVKLKNNIPALLRYIILAHHNPIYVMLIVVVVADVTLLCQDGL